MQKVAVLPAIHVQFANGFRQNPKKFICWDSFYCDNPYYHYSKFNIPNRHP